MLDLDQVLGSPEFFNVFCMSFYLRSFNGFVMWWYTSATYILNVNRREYERCKRKGIQSWGGSQQGFSALPKIFQTGHFWSKQTYLRGWWFTNRHTGKWNFLPTPRTNLFLFSRFWTKVFVCRISLRSSAVSVSNSIALSRHWSVPSFKWLQWWIVFCWWLCFVSRKKSIFGFQNFTDSFVLRFFSFLSSASSLTVWRFIWLFLHDQHGIATNEGSVNCVWGGPLPSELVARKGGSWATACITRSSVALGVWPKRTSGLCCGKKTSILFAIVKLWDFTCSLQGGFSVAISDSSSEGGSNDLKILEEGFRFSLWPYDKPMTRTSLFEAEKPQSCQVEGIDPILFEVESAGCKNFSRFLYFFKRREFC